MLLTMTCLKLSIYTQAQRELDTSMVFETIDFLYIVEKFVDVIFRFL